MILLGSVDNRKTLIDIFFLLNRFSIAVIKLKTSVPSKFAACVPAQKISGFLGRKQKRNSIQLLTRYRWEHGWVYAFMVYKIHNTWRQQLNLPGVNFGQTASANGEGFGSITRIALFEDEEAIAEADDDGLFWALLLLGLPKGWHLRRFVGRWLRLSQSSDRFSVAQAILSCLQWLIESLTVFTGFLNCGHKTCSALQFYRSAT